MQTIYLLIIIFLGKLNDEIPRKLLRNLKVKIHFGWRLFLATFLHASQVYKKEKLLTQSNMITKWNNNLFPDFYYEINLPIVIVL